jgi:GT2 family glycosyltransferase
MVQRIDMETHFPSVAIVVLTWNNSIDTLECLDSVSQLTYPNLHTIVVDNGSTDGSVDRIRQRYPAIDLLVLASNLGYAAGNNAGLQHALELQADYILILNNDTLVAPDLIDELIRVAEANPRIGMVGPLMYCTQPRDRLFAAGSVIRWRYGDTQNRGMFEPTEMLKEWTQPEAVDYITGCAVMIKRSCLEVIGSFQADYYINYEDTEWGLKAQRAGFEVWYVPAAVIWHKVSVTIGLSSPLSAYYMTRNRLMFFWRNASVLTHWLIVFRISLRILRTILAWSVWPRYRSAKYRRLRLAIWLGLRDFLRGRIGEMGADVARACADQS